MRHASAGVPAERFPAILLEIAQEVDLDASQKRAIQTYRSRLGERGLSRFEVLGRNTDRDLIRVLACCLAGDEPEAPRQICIPALGEL